MKYEKWVEMWGNAMSIVQRRPADYAKNITLRYVVHSLLPGDSLRFTFDNFCGTDDIKISKAACAVCRQNGDIIEETSVDITFDGNFGCTVKKGCMLCSDEIAFEVRRGMDIAVSFYLSDYTEMRSGVVTTGPLSKGRFSIGDHVNDEVLPINDTMSLSEVYFLSRIDVKTVSTARAVVCYGDSITAQDWPEQLSLLLEENNIQDISVVRRAVSGTRILRQYDCILYQSYGLKGNIRFPHEMGAAGADTIIIQQGINDIIHPVGEDVNVFRPMSDLPTAEELTEGLKYYIEESRKEGLKVYIGTLLPIEGWRTYADFREKLREEVNCWIRTTRLTDGCIDFDKRLCDKERPQRFAEGFDSGDHLHPSKEAYREMAAEALKYIL